MAGLVGLRRTTDLNAVRANVDAMLAKWLELPDLTRVLFFQSGAQSTSDQREFLKERSCGHSRLHAAR